MSGFRKPHTIEEMKPILDFLKEKEKITVIDACNDECKDDKCSTSCTKGLLTGTDPEVYRHDLTKLISIAYRDKPPVKPGRSMHPVNTLYYWLSSDDIKRLKMFLGTAKERAQGALTKLVAGGAKYLSLKNLRTKYSIKMATIYDRITGDIEAGAPHLVPLEPDVVQANVEEEAYEDFLAVGANEDDLQGERDDEATELEILTQLKPVVDYVDPEDPLPKHMDVFKTDEEIQQMGQRVVGGPSMVYSFFNTIEGAGIFSKILDLHGFTEFRDLRQHIDVTTLNRQPRYAFIKGGMPLRLKVNVMKVFNSKANVHGQLIRVVFVTQAAAEGISLFNLRQIHIMEPFWDNMMIEQVIGRGFRIKAHQHITDIKDRFITVYKYIAETTDDKVSTDQILVSIAKRKDRFREEVKTLRVRAAVDCLNNSEYNELEQGCFFFSNVDDGSAYSFDIAKDAGDKETQVVGKRELKGAMFTVNSRRYVTFEEIATIEIRTCG